MSQEENTYSTPAAFFKKRSRRGYIGHMNAFSIFRRSLSLELGELRNKVPPPVYTKVVSQKWIESPYGQKLYH
ncbi:hypothetical protein RCL_jg16776.t1 [Rhizophagus clarus]|uniref:Uncharacterized protein n=1 Tax=Rhizophagus clarus TaxID=94130 RepID=A0A8H3QQ58_9GLOM|nr:hypothetical protein RCL_jg16776.t1 [Rhizophagus clarus]